MCTLSYCHHQIWCMNYRPFFRVRSWNNVTLVCPAMFSILIFVLAIWRGICYVDKMDRLLIAKINKYKKNDGVVTFIICFVSEGWLRSPSTFWRFCFGTAVWHLLVKSMSEIPNRPFACCVEFCQLLLSDIQCSTKIHLVRYSMHFLD